MTYREARVYLDDMSKYGSVLGLDTVRALLGELGNPQDGLKFIHVAGTNGKGSILAYVSTILREAGFLVGRYVSPTVVSYLEKIQVDGRWIGEDEFAALVEKVQKAVACMETNGRGHPTVFEMETAMAFLYFREKKCDYVVLETGLGGRLDATNVVENTVLAIFSSIGRDHMGILGDTLTEIAGEKAGIMKPGCRVVSAAQKPEVRKALEERAAQLGCPITFARPENARVVEEDYKGMRFSYTLTDSQSPLARSASNAGCPEGYTLTDSQSPPALRGHGVRDALGYISTVCFPAKAPENNIPYVKTPRPPSPGQVKTAKRKSFRQGHPPPSKYKKPPPAISSNQRPNATFHNYDLTANSSSITAKNQRRNEKGKEPSQTRRHRPPRPGRLESQHHCQKTSITS